MKFFLTLIQTIVKHLVGKYSSFKNKRIKELDLICEISIANLKKYANTIGSHRQFLLILHFYLILSVL